MSDPADAEQAPKLLQLPERVHTVEEMAGLISKLESVNHIIVVVEDAVGIITMALDGTTAERMNWMLDRAKFLLHRAD